LSRPQGPGKHSRRTDVCGFDLGARHPHDQVRKHKDKDLTDLASEACLGALADAGLTMAQMQVMACGNLMQAHTGLG
jgi:hypothetical protein